MGTGTAEGEGRGVAAADAALSSPLLEDIDIQGASGVLINVSHGENYSLLEHNEAMEHIYDAVGEEGNPNIIVGDITLPELGDKVCITIIATGCGGSNNAAAMNYAGVGTAAYQMNQAQAQYQAAAPVQAATPRPTTNFLALAGRNTASMPTASMPATPTVATPAVTQRVVPATAPAAPSYTAPQNSYTNTVRQAAPVNAAAAMFAPASSFASPSFDAKASYTEETVATTKSIRETEEMPGAAEADPLSNGNYASSYKQESHPAQTEQVNTVDYATPAYMRSQKGSEDALKESNVDYDLPAFMRMNDLF
jgi:cell division protein FtsZ